MHHSRVTRAWTRLGSSAGARPGQPDARGRLIKLDQLNVAAISAQERPNPVQDNFDILAREHSHSILLNAVWPSVHGTQPSRDSGAPQRRAIFRPTAAYRCSIAHTPVCSPPSTFGARGSRGHALRRARPHLPGAHEHYLDRSRGRDCHCGCHPAHSAAAPSTGFRECQSPLDCAAPVRLSLSHSVRPPPGHGATFPATRGDEVVRFPRVPGRPGNCGRDGVRRR